MKQHYDIIIVGGGMVGASLAAALLPSADELQLSIALVETYPVTTQASDEYQPSYDSRATALAYGSRSIYEEMGIWSQLREHLAPIEHIHVSDRGHYGVTQLHAEQQKVAALGYVVENRWLGQVLIRHLMQQATERVDIICPAEVDEIDTGSAAMAVTINVAGEQHRLTSELVVMADGGRSELREKLGISYTKNDYQQHALVTNVSPDRPHQGIAYERFTDSGPMALLPLEDDNGLHRCGLVWTLPDEQIDEVLALSDDDFIARLHQRFGYRAGNFIKVGERHSYPLKLSLAEEQVRRGLVVLGNAAHALHPIAGQGYNLALRGVAALAEKLITARRQGDNLGDLQHLQAFYDQQGYDQQRTIDFSDQTMKLFSNSNPLLSLGRSIGLQLLDISPTGKTLLSRAAMGVDLPVPKLR